MDFLLPFLQSTASLLTAAVSLIAAILSAIKAWRELPSRQPQPASSGGSRATLFSRYGIAALFFFVLSAALIFGWYDVNYNKSYDELVSLGDTASTDDIRRYNEAINYYNRAIRMDPQAGIVYAKLALAQMKSGVNKEVYVGNCDTALSLTSGNDFVLFNCGIVYISADQYEKAISSYDRFLLLFPQERNAYYYRGRAYRLSGMFDLAKADYELCVSLSEVNNDKDDFYYDNCQKELTSISN